MPEGVAAQDARLARSSAVLLSGAVGVRLVTSIIAGFLEWQHSAQPGFEEARLRAGDVLTSFGAAGDGVSMVLLVLAAIAVWWCQRAGDSAAATLRSVVNGACGGVAVLAVMNAIGVALFDSVLDQTSRTVVGVGNALAVVVVAVGTVAFLQRYDAAISGLAFDEPGIDAFVFAVDRKSGDVRAFLSAGEAVRGMHVYWVEDDEFAFYTDEGVLLDASVVSERIVLSPTETVRSEELLTGLRAFVTRRGIPIPAEEADDPAAYAVPIARWQRLELWPPWLRPLGRLFQPRG